MVARAAWWARRDSRFKFAPGPDSELQQRVTEPWRSTCECECECECECSLVPVARAAWRAESRSRPGPGQATRVTVVPRGESRWPRRVANGGV